MNTTASPDLPLAVKLYPGFPNPFATSVTLSYDLPKSTAVRLSIYDVLGREVAVLIDTEQAAGRWSATWTGRNQAGAKVPPGVYFCRMQTPGFVQTRSLIVQR